MLNSHLLTSIITNLFSVSTTSTCSNSSLTPTQVALTKFSRLSARSLNTFLYNTTFHNRSSRTFTSSEVRLLSYGLNFVPSPKLPPLCVFQRGVAKLARAMRLRWYFKRPLDDSNKIFVANPFFQPPDSPPPPIERFLSDLESEVIRWHQEALTLYKNFGCNFRSMDFKNLMNLSSDPSLNFSKSDKNLGFNVFDDKDYYQEAVRVVTDPLVNKPVTEFEAITVVHRFIDNTRLLCRTFLPFGLSEDDCDFIEQDFSQESSSPNFPEFYILPKLHKQPWQGRPITLQTKFVSRWAAKWLTVHLNAFCETLPTALKDSLSLVKQLENLHLPSDCDIFTGDVRSLYPSIDSKVGVELVKRTLIERSGWKGWKIEFICQLLSLILSCTVFKFRNQFFLQINGTAMGVSCAPPYAIIVMFALEHNVITMEYVLFYTRYIDDVFCITRKGFAEKLRVLLDSLVPWIKFDWACSGDTADFLDLTIFKDHQFHITGLLSFKVFQKRFNLYQYITFFSDHPRSMKKGFIRGVLLAHAVRCSREIYFLDYRLAFFERLIARGYPRAFLSPIFSSVKYADRKTLLSGDRQRSKKNAPLLLNFPFSRAAAAADFAGFLRNKWHLVKAVDKENIFPNCPLIVWSKGRNIFDVVRTNQKHIMNLKLSLS